MAGTLIRQQIREKIDHNKLIEEFDLEHCLAPASYELRVGTYLDRKTDSLIELSASKTILIPPGGFILVGSYEKVNLPNDLLQIQ